MQINKQGTLCYMNVLSLHERHQSSHSRGSVASQQVTRMFSSKHPDDRPKARVYSPYIPPTLCISITLVMSLNDITIICFPLPVRKTLCMHRKAMLICLCTCQHPHWLFFYSYAQTSCQFHIPNFEPVTHTHIYIIYFIMYIQ